METKQSAAPKSLSAEFKSVLSFIAKEKLIPEGSTIMLGLSGGPDSVFLFHLLLHLKNNGLIKNFIAAHLDHEWRTDSAQDALFCQKLADAYSIPFETQKISELKHLKWNGSKEEIARNARRFFLESVLHAHNADAIALGQHAQDQQETFFIRLLRGATLSGLSGMHPQHGRYIRPLLTTNKSDILTYLHNNNITYLEDPTNVSQEFLRNRIRSTVIPALKEADSRFETNFKKTLKNIQDTESYLEQHTQQIFNQISSRKNGQLMVSWPDLLAQDPFMQNRLILFWLITEKVPFSPSEALIKEILRFLDSPRGGSHTICPGWAVKKSSKIGYIST